MGRALVLVRYVSRLPELWRSAHQSSPCARSARSSAAAVRFWWSVRTLGISSGRG